MQFAQSTRFLKSIRIYQKFIHLHKINKLIFSPKETFLHKDLLHETISSTLFDHVKFSSSFSLTPFVWCCRAICWNLAPKFTIGTGIAIYKLIGGYYHYFVKILKGCPIDPCAPRHPWSNELPHNYMIDRSIHLPNWLLSYLHK